MNPKELNKYYTKFKFGEDSFHNLMQNKTHEILLVSTFYDAFIFEQDGRLSEQIYGEYKQLNLSTAPKITSVPTGDEALEILKKRNFDLVITMLHIGITTPFMLAKKIKEDSPNQPVVLLLSTISDLEYLEVLPERKEYFDKIFLWNGDSKIFLAIVKSIEDKLNLKHDTKKGLVRVVLLVEDSIKFYSVFLPLLYQEIVRQTQLLIKTELNDINKRLRMRARPKVILVHNYEDAMKIYEEYKEFLIAVISDINFPKQGKMDGEAGIKLISKIKSEDDGVATLLLSSEDSNKIKADAINSLFIHKSSSHLLTNIKNFIINNLGFGEFVFRNKDGEEILRAGGLAEFEDKLSKVDRESIIFHTQRNHFSTWLMARGEIQIAKKLRPLKLKDFDNDVDKVREYLVSTIDKIQVDRNRGTIINFHDYSLPEANEIIRISEGSLGGKGRGLAFLNSLLVAMDFEEQFPNAHVLLPGTSIIGTNEYDQFIEHNNIADYKMETMTDDEIDTLFLKGYLTDELKSKLTILLNRVKYPVAVRSSGLLEDSIAQPLAGVYRTFMLPNNHPDVLVRLKQLTDAIKLVFASVFIKNAREYIKSLSHQLDEEKMAVIIQEVVGTNYDDKYFYPHVAGTAQSYNFYPIANMKHEDGLVSLAVGLGKSVVDGSRIFRFCPRYPKSEFLKHHSLLTNSQKDFFAINLEEREFDLKTGDEATLDKLDISIGEQHGSIKHTASVWNYDDNRLVPGLRKQGPRVITFDNLIKYEYFPLADILNKILDIGHAAFGLPVEIEFAVDLMGKKKFNNLPAFYILQIRPMALSSEDVQFNLDNYSHKSLVLSTEQAMGNGVISDIHDIIYIDEKKFDKTKTIEMQKEIEEFNLNMREKGKKYILFGPGRWGSKDRFLGIPVRYVQINNACVIIETALKDFNIDPSQGTHFFHNIIARKIGYFSIPFNSGNDFINWEWIHRQTVVKRSEFFVHANVSKPMKIMMDGKSGRAIIIKNGSI